MLPFVINPPVEWHGRPMSVWESGGKILSFQSLKDSMGWNILPYIFGPL